MTTHFSRSIRVLDADKFRPSLWIVAMGVVILLIWMAWFFLSQMTLTETSSDLQIVEDSFVHAEFSLDAAKKIRAGQKGSLQLDTDTVKNVDVIVRQRLPKQGEIIPVELFVIDTEFYKLPRPENAIEEVEIEVGQSTPAMLVLRATGNLINKSKESK